MSKRSVCRQFPNVSKVIEEKIVCRRKAQKISQAKLAEIAGVTRNCIQQLECYEHLPLPSTMFLLIRALHFSDEEAARFWVEMDAAYMRDRQLQGKVPQANQGAKR